MTEKKQLCHLSCHHLIPERGSSTDCFSKPHHGEVNNATDVGSALHDLSPLQKKIQSAWDDLVYRVSMPLDPPVLGTDACYSLHRRAILLPGQKTYQLLVLET